MITGITGILLSVEESLVVLEAGAFEYELFVPEFVRKHLVARLGETVNLRTIDYLEGNPQQGRLTPRLVGFTSTVEREFFELFCSVDGVGVKKALRAMVRPVPQVATAIEEQDVDLLTTLPGIGPAVAERIVAKLRRKMARFALMVERELPPDQSTPQDVLNDAQQALLALGHTPVDARKKIEAAISGKTKKFKTVDELLRAIYQHERK